MIYGYILLTDSTKRHVHSLPVGDPLPHFSDAHCFCQPVTEPLSHDWTMFYHCSFADEEAALQEGLLDVALGRVKPAVAIRRELNV